MYCQHCRCHKRSDEAIKAELDAMDPIFDAIHWVAVRLIPKRVQKWLTSDLGTESTGPN